MSEATSFRSNVRETLAKGQKRLCRTIVNYPVRYCLCQWLMVFLVSGIVIVNNWFAFADIGLNDFIVFNEADTQNFFALEDAVDQVDEQNITVTVRSIEIFSLAFQFLYQTSSGDLLSPANLQEICEVEQLVFGQDLYPAYCLTTAPNGENTLCSNETLAVSFHFYGTDNPDCTELSAAEISQSLDRIPDFERSFIFDNFENPTTLRTLIPLAGPLGVDSPPFKTFADVPGDDLDDEQVSEGYQILYEAFFDSLFDFYNIQDSPLSPAYFTPFFSRSGSDLEVRNGGFFVDSLRFEIIIATDQGLSAGTYIVVFIFMLFYVRSFTLSSLSMLSIAMSLLIGVFLYRGILQIDYFTPLNILILFLIGGVGADNVFVLFDAWRQSKEEYKHLIANSKADEKETKEETKPEKDEEKAKEGKEEKVTDKINEDLEEAVYKEYLVERLNYSYGRAAFSVSQTASTTFIAFIATINSQVSVISALGLYGALVILTNFWYMLTLHPGNLMFYHYLFVLKRNYSNAKKDLEVKAKVEHTNSFRKALSYGLSFEWVDVCFQKYIWLLLDTHFAKVSIILMAVLMTVMISSTTQLETPSGLESNYPPGHMLEDFSDDFNNLFTSGTADSFTEVEGVFGIESFDLISKRFETADVGDVVFDDSFEIYSSSSQDFIISVCNDLVKLGCNEDGCLEDTLLLQESGVACVLVDFRKFLLNQTSFTFSFVDPNTEGAFDTEEDFLLAFKAFLGSPFGVDFVNNVGFVDGDIKFLTLTYRMSMLAFQPLVIKDPVVNLFDDFGEVVRNNASDGLDTFYQTSFDHFYRHTEVELISGLFIGLAISLSASFVVLLFGTNNPRVAFFASLSVGGVVGSVLGTARYLDFELGTAESIAGVFVIGLAIDYIVHLGHLFMHSRTFLEGEPNPYKDSTSILHKIFGQTGEVAYKNRDMLRFSIEKIGPTVLAGALTTFGAAAFLSACTFAFFRKMSVLLMFTILYSLGYAFLLFLPLLRVLGPGLRG